MARTSLPRETVSSVGELMEKRLITGDLQRAMIVADYLTIGAKLTYTSWEVPRRTMYRYVKKAKHDPEFAKLVQAQLNRIAERIVVERSSLAMSAQHAMKVKLRAGDSKLDEYTNAVVAMARVTGTHEGDKQAYAARAPIVSSGGGATSGVAIAVPLILTTTRPDVPNPKPVTPPPADE